MISRMKKLPTAIAALALLPALTGHAATGKVPPKHTSTVGTAVAAVPARLKPGEYLWVPEVSPRGPIVMIVSLPEQLAYVYRNGVLIGASTVSTGKKGHETPTGVFTILQKNEDHYSNVYDDAPMPYMQRLTWSGVALHAGRLPGYPASHGCVRMPYEFAQKLYGETKTGLTVVVSDEEQFPGTVAHPGLVAPVDVTGQPLSEPSLVSELVLAAGGGAGGPGHDPGHERGPTHQRVPRRRRDRPRTVHAQGPEPEDHAARADHARAVRGRSARPGTGKPIPRWLMVSGQQENSYSTEQLLSVFDVPPDFLRKVATVVGPGTTMVVTQPAATTSTRTTVATDFTVVTADAPTADPR